MRKPDSIAGRIARIGRYTGPVARKSPRSNEVSVETAIHFTLENDPTIYTTSISRFSTRDKATGSSNSVAKDRSWPSTASCKVLMRRAPRCSDRLQATHFGP